MNYIYLSCVIVVIYMASESKGLFKQTTPDSSEDRQYNEPIKDSVSIITGGTRGLGRDFVEHILREGGKVAFGGTNTALGEKVEKELAAKYGADKVLFTTLDVTNQESFENIFKKTKAKWGPQIDFLINNAGVGHEDRNNWEKTIDINLKGSIRGQLLAIDHMGEHKGGKGGTVVHISSRVALISGFQWPIYSTTKKSQLGFVEAMGHEFYEDHFNIRTLALCPAITDTELPAHQGKNPFIPALIPVIGNRTQNLITQKPSSVSKGLLQIMRNATCGTVWLVENDEHPRQIRFWNDF